jgi:hypothetical protein
MSKPLIIKLDMDRSAAKASMKEQTADERAMIAETKRGISEVLEQEASAAKTKDAIHKQTFRQRVAAALGIKTVEKSANDAAVSGVKSIGESGAASFAKVQVGIDLAKMGLRELIGLASGFGAAMKAAAEESKRLSGQFAGSRDQLQELATVMGEKNDNAFTLKNAKFNTATGMKEAEGLAFRTQFHNSGEQFAGKNLSKEEFAQFEKQAAQLTTAKGLSPEDSGDLAGSILGFKDRKGLGENASEDALGKFNSGLSILGRGKGRNKVLINQFSMLSSASLNSDEMKGTFTDSDEVATVISVMAEKHDAQAAEMAQAANRGLRDFDGKASDLLKKAGVNAQTKFIDAVKQITPLIEQEAKDKKLKVEDVLKLHFDDQLTREALGVAINKGVTGGAFDDRLEFAKGNQGPAPAMKAISDYDKSEAGMSRKADASVKEAELVRGAENSKVDILRKQALADLIKEKKINTTGTNFQDYIDGKLGFGVIGHNEQSRIDAQVFAKLNTRDPSNKHVNEVMPISPEARERAMNSQIKEIEAVGGNPFKDYVDPKERAQIIADNTKALNENTEEMKRQRPGANPPGHAPTVPPIVPVGVPNRAVR